MNKVKNLLLMAAVVFFVASCGDDAVNTPTPVSPEIIQILPEEIFSNEIFTITGKNFGNENAEILVDEKNAEITSWTDTLVKARIAMDEGTYPVYVKINVPNSESLKSNTKNITIKPKLEDPDTILYITSVEPESGYRGDEIEIRGTLFGATRGTSQITFGEIIANTSDYISWTDTLIKCKVPALAAIGYCEISILAVAGAESNHYSFTVLEKTLNPTITDILPASGIKEGTTVTISGNEFGATQKAESYLMLNSIKISNVLAWSNTSIIFIVPEGAETGTIKVVAEGISSNLHNITIDKDQEQGENPEITSLAITSITYYGGTQIFGHNFGTEKGKVFLQDDVEAEIVNWKDNEIRITIPGPGEVKGGELYVVTAKNKISNKVQYFIQFADPIKMVLIQAGSFTMGNNDSEEESEKPEHIVNIARSFYVSETEITQEQYKRYVSLNMFQPANSANHPANNLTFYEVCNWCNEASKSVGLEPCYTISGTTVQSFNYNASGYRLLTDAEWEYAARAGTGNQWGFTGSLGEYAWYADNHSTQNPNYVKTKKANDWGLYDMNGNVEEWVWDRYSWDYYSESNNANNPTGPATGVSRVMRGGNYQQGADKCKATAKGNRQESQRNYNLGFRIARTQ